NYDQLVDGPVEIGTFKDTSFQAGGAPYRVVVDAASSDYDMDRVVTMVKKIVVAATSWMDDRPFDHYVFIYHFPGGPGRGGMEHSNSTAIELNRGVLAAHPEYLSDVTAHEFFHLWNVKRIRPQSLEPVDYTREMWTPALWFAEGVTSTYAAYTLVRTGIWNHAQFLADLGAQITELESRPARAWQSAEESSLDTWFDKYSLYDRPDFSISYYNKGQLLGLTLDILIRDATENRASLDDVLRRMNQEYAQRGRSY